MLNIIDVIAHVLLLGMDVWEQAEIDRTTVETLDQTKNERCWSRANSNAKATLAMTLTVCRAGAASEVSLNTYTSTDGHEVFVRTGPLNETSPSLTAASSIPSTLQASLIFSVAHSLTLVDKFDWSTVTMEQQVLCL